MTKTTAFLIAPLVGAAAAAITWMVTPHVLDYLEKRDFKKMQEEFPEMKPVQD